MLTAACIDVDQIDQIQTDVKTASPLPQSTVSRFLRLVAYHTKTSPPAVLVHEAPAPLKHIEHRSWP
jgi:hypothetical protein